MKTLLSAVVLGFSSFSMAASCPFGMDTQVNCKSSPVAGDSDLASGALDSVSVCSQNGVYNLVLQKGTYTRTEVAKVDQLPGGISLMIGAGDVDFTFSYPLGTPASPTKPATLTITLRSLSNVSASSSYVCTK